MNKFFYIVSTDIGNIQENSIYALDLLKKSDLIIYESFDKLKSLERFIDTKFSNTLKLNKFNEKHFVKYLDYLINFNSVCLVSDAGYPTISDPGFFLITKIREQNIFMIKVVNGPNSILPSLIYSGYKTNSFYYLGFLDKRTNTAKKILLKCLDIKTSIIIFCSPYSLIKTILLIKNIFGEKIPLTVCREISKKYETIYHLNENYQKNLGEIKLKGEFVIIIDNNE